MPAAYALKITYKRAGTDSEIKAEVISDAEGKVLKIIVTIKSELMKENKSGLIKDYKGLRASVKFCDNDKPIDDIDIIMRDDRFWGLVQYYEKEILEPTSREQLLLNGTKVAQESEENVRQNTNLLADLIRILLPIPASRIKNTATAEILLLLKYIQQKLSIWTSITVRNQEEIIIAKTYFGYRNLTLLDRKFPSVLFYLHLANVVLANQLVLKPATDFIARFQKTISLLKKRALPYSCGIAIVNFGVNFGFDVWLKTFDKIRVQSNPLLTPDPSIPDLFLSIFLSILPFVWPLLGFLVRRYGSQIVNRIVRYAISIILNSPNYNNSFMDALGLNRISSLLQASEHHQSILLRLKLALQRIFKY
jgi:hypothetical protein